jgi:membrane protein DedA with SNARE-associated domain
VNFEWLESMVREWGYLAILVGTFLEGETILVLGGIAARQGHLDLKTVMLCAFAGSLISDQLAFLIGRRWGSRWLMRKPGRAERFERARALIDRHQTLITLIFRFLYGLRNVIPFALGMSRMKASRYVVLNIIGAAVWAVTLAALGWGLAEAAHLFMEDVKSGQTWFLLGLALLALGFWITYRVREARRRRERLAKEAELAQQQAAGPAKPEADASVAKGAG